MTHDSRLDLRGALPTGRLVIEASAGTGKTYSLSALVVRHVVERRRAASELLLVTFTRAAAAELRDRARTALVAALATTTLRVVPAEHDWMDILLLGSDDEIVERGRLLEAAISTFDDATITTIHGFCQLALRQLGLSSGAAIDTELSDSTSEIVAEVCRDLVVEALRRDTKCLNWPTDATAPSPSAVLEHLSKAVSEVLGNRGTRLVPDLATAKSAEDDRPGRLHTWVELVHRGVAEVGARQRARQLMGYDELITGLHDAVHHPITGPGAVATLRGRYSLVLVDEFQDTDAVQWRTFEKIFDGDLITVGDPKQAIYRFRGADVFAYLDAVHGAPRLDLATNFRSDALLIAATNALITDVHLGDSRIKATPVSASPTAVATSLDAGAPLSIRVMPSHERIMKDGKVQSGLGDDAVLDDMVAVTIDLLRNHHRTKHGVAQPLTPGDIAVLVPSNTLAGRVVDSLTKAGVPAVRARTGSVLNSPAVQHFRELLAALEQPSNGSLVRAAAFGVFLHTPPQSLDPSPPDAATAAANEQVFNQLQRTVAVWADLLARRPFLAWYDQVRAECRLAAQLLAEPTGERQLTDLDHLAEVLGAELGGRPVTAAVARRTLDRLVADADDSSQGPQMRRIDSDALAVQVSTIHGSKGLEFPVVLLPFSWKAQEVKAPYSYHLPGGPRTIDIASDQGWIGDRPHETPTGRVHHAEEGARGDALRLLYVALTRSRHRTVLWWVPYPGSAKSALNRVLFDRDHTGAPANTPLELLVDEHQQVTSSVPNHMPADDGDTHTRLATLAARANEAAPEGGPDLIEIVQCPTAEQRATWSPPPPAEAPPALTLADHRGRAEAADPFWRKWSFTGITRDRHDAWVPTMPTTGGADEPDDPEAGAGMLETEVEVPEMPWATVAGGTGFGTLVHEVLERIDPTSPTLHTDVHDTVWAMAGGARRVAPPTAITTGLLAAIRTPMGDVCDGLRLADISPADRLAELDFDMPLCPGGAVPAAQIGKVLLATLPPDDPQRAYAQQLAEGRFPTDLKGFLGGSIDAVLRIGTGAQQRFVVVDYKTNRLHDRDAAAPLEAYRPEALPKAMADSDYPLQALLYSVAVHRMLRWRLGAAYSPQQHLGGIAYLFLRGMVGPATPVDEHGAPYGVFAWRPPAATVLELDRLFAEGGAA